MSILDIERLPLHMIDAWLPALERMRKDREREQREAAAAEREAAARG